MTDVKRRRNLPTRDEMKKYVEQCMADGLAQSIKESAEKLAAQQAELGNRVDKTAGELNDLSTKAEETKKVADMITVTADEAKKTSDGATAKADEAKNMADEAKRPLMKQRRRPMM